MTLVWMISTPTELMWSRPMPTAGMPREKVMVPPEYHGRHSLANAGLRTSRARYV